MASIVDSWFPPTREHYELILTCWQFAYPVIGSMQWLIAWYGMGKTSVASVLNIPGRVAWMSMECPGFLTLLWTMKTLSEREGVELAWQNKLLAGLFVMHYAYRAVLFPLLQPSMSPIHAGVWVLAASFQVCNATCLGSWLGAYGPTTEVAWAEQTSGGQTVLGVGVFCAGLAANYFHDEELREIRRREQRRRQSSKSSGTVDKHYQIPQAGLFRYLLYPHYLCEWIEWFGFWMAAGWGCVPARAFLVNEVVTMLPRAVRGKRWYVERFGGDKVGSRWAILPGVL